MFFAEISSNFIILSLFKLFKEEIISSDGEIFWDIGFITKVKNIKLGADAIIGNDWHTGPISAILRQLSTVKKYYGMDPQKADKLQNIPIMTILHNVEYQGSVWHSQEKLLNIMFGEHAAKIVENAFMPDISVKADSLGLPQKLWNSLMVGRDINPQMMAASYSDILIPVSHNYSQEIGQKSTEID